MRMRNRQTPPFNKTWWDGPRMPNRILQKVKQGVASTKKSSYDEIKKNMKKKSDIPTSEQLAEKQCDLFQKEYAGNTNH